MVQAQGIDRHKPVAAGDSAQPLGGSFQQLMALVMAFQFFQLFAVLQCVILHTAAGHGVIDVLLIFHGQNPEHFSAFQKHFHIPKTLGRRLRRGAVALGCILQIPWFDDMPSLKKDAVE